MATTYVDNGGAVNGSNKEYTFSFPYLKTEDVKVSLNGLTQATTKYTVTTSPTKITFNGTSVDSTVQESDGSPKTGVTVRVYRDTDVDTAKAVYSSGSSIRAGDLNDNQDQILYALQEEQADTINTHRITNVAVTRDKIRADAIDGTLIADDVIDSEHYVAGSIDLEHMSANSVDSDQYVDGSIDLIHLATNSVDSSKIVDDSIVNADVNASAAIAHTKLNIPNVTTSASGYMSAADKTKLDAIETGATADQTGAQIKTSYEAESNTNAYTDAEKTKLTGIATGAEVNVQSDWNASSGDAQILNKPSLDKALNDLTDVTTSGVGDGKILKYVAANSRWEVAEDATGAGGAALTDGDKGDITVSNSGATFTIDNDTIGLDELSASGTASNTKFLRGDNTWADAGSSLTVKDEGTDKTTAATSIDFVGAGVTATNSGAAVTVTVSGGGGNTSTDFQYLELKAHNNASGAFSAGAADYELVTKGTTTAITPAQAAALIISIGGVIQEPNTGTSIGSNDGFCIDGSSIHFGANLTEHPDFIIYLQGAGVASIADNTVTGAKIALGSDAAGDIMYYNGTDYARLPKGSAGQMLQINAGATAPEWTAAPSGTTNLSNTANGTSLTVESSSGTNTALPAATTSAWGVMTDDDKTKLDGIATAANAYAISADLLDEDNMATNSATKVASQQSVKAYVDANSGGASADDCMYKNSLTISNAHTIAVTEGAHSVGPITLNATVTVNGRWVIS